MADNLLDLLTLLDRLTVFVLMIAAHYIVRQRTNFFFFFWHILGEIMLCEMTMVEWATEEWI